LRDALKLLDSEDKKYLVEKNIPIFIDPQSSLEHMKLIREHKLGDVSIDYDESPNEIAGDIKKQLDKYRKSHPEVSVEKPVQRELPLVEVEPEIDEKEKQLILLRREIDKLQGQLEANLTARRNKDQQIDDYTNKLKGLGGKSKEIKAERARVQKLKVSAEQELVVIKKESARLSDQIQALYEAMILFENGGIDYGKKRDSVYLDETINGSGDRVISNMDADGNPCYDEAFRKKMEDIVENPYVNNPSAQAKWDAKQDRRLSREEKGFKTEYIIIHSTNSDEVNSVVVGQAAHFGVSKDGEVYYVVDDSKYMDHAGNSQWNGKTDISNYSIGIEVANKPGEPWTPKQYEAMKKLVHYLGVKYEIPQKNVLTHYQVAKSEFGRGRKVDPYYRIDWDRLGLPDNSKLVDKDVANGRVLPNLSEVVYQLHRLGVTRDTREDFIESLRDACLISHLKDPDALKQRLIKTLTSSGIPLKDTRDLTDRLVKILSSGPVHI